MNQARDYRIRYAGEADRQQMSSMWTDFLEEQARLDPRFVVADDAHERWHNDYSEWIGASVQGLFVADADPEALIGFASVRLFYPSPIYRPELEAYLEELYVIPAWRRRGVATSLLGSVTDWAKANNARRIRLGVLGANLDGLAFWKRFGGRPFVETLLIDL